MDCQIPQRVETIKKVTLLMEFVNIILQNSNLKEAKLYGAAQKAATNPEIGITIQNKAAYHVIKDCATIAMCYLPHLVFGSYVNPFESLKGKFKKEVFFNLHNFLYALRSAFNESLLVSVSIAFILPSVAYAFQPPVLRIFFIVP